jgi:putative membrane protein
MGAPLAVKQMLDLISLGLVGVLAGVATGFTPGIHPNTVIFSSIPVYLSSGLGFMSYASFISGLSISHTFHDFLPSIYLQAPDAETAMSTMPGAEKAAEGRGPEAFHSTLLGGIISMLVVCMMLPVLFMFLNDFYALLEPIMAFMITFFLFFLVFQNELFPAAVTCILSGALGIITLNSSSGGNFILMPVFTGLFAIPAISSSVREELELPEQELDAEFKGEKGSFTGALAGFIAGTVPGVGAAVSTTFLSPFIDDRKDFMAGMGGVNTTDIIVSFIALLLIGKARSGASVAFQSLKSPVQHQIIFLIGLSVFCGSISALLALRSEKIFLKAINRIKFRYVGVSTISLVLILSLVLSGIFGLITAVTGTFIGFYSMRNKCRACCMAVLLVPSILFFI